MCRLILVGLMRLLPLMHAQKMLAHLLEDYPSRTPPSSIAARASTPVSLATHYNLCAYLLPHPTPARTVPGLSYRTVNSPSARRQISPGSCITDFTYMHRRCQASAGHIQRIQIIVVVRPPQLPAARRPTPRRNLHYF